MSDREWRIAYAERELAGRREDSVKLADLRAEFARTKHNTAWSQAAARGYLSCPEDLSEKYLRDLAERVVRVGGTHDAQMACLRAIRLALRFAREQREIEKAEAWVAHERSRTE